MLVEFFNINYQEYIPGHNSGDSWVPEKSTSFSINQVFPVILKDPLRMEVQSEFVKGG